MTSISNVIVIVCGVVIRVNFFVVVIDDVGPQKNWLGWMQANVFRKYFSLPTNYLASWAERLPSELQTSL